MLSKFVRHCLILIPVLATLVGCTNAKPTVTSLVSKPGGPAATPTPVPQKDSQNFAQLSAGSQKTSWSSAYKGTLRVSPPGGSQMQATSPQGYKLQGTVTFQR